MAQPKDFGFGEDEQMLRDGARKFLSDHAGPARVRQTVARDHHEAYESEIPPAHYDAAQWRQMVDLGWTSVAIPEKSGGAGMNMAALAALSEEIGRAALDLAPADRAHGGTGLHRDGRLRAGVLRV